MANEFLRDRIHRKLANLPDERLYQVLDFVEFLESRYAAEPATTSNLFQRFAEGVEDRLRAGRVSASTIAETMNLMHRAVGVLNGVAAAGKSVASDIVNVATAPAPPPAAPRAPDGTQTARTAQPGASTDAPTPPPAGPAADRGDRPA